MAYLEDFPEATSLLDFARRLEQTQTFDASSSTTAIELYQLAVESDPFNPEARVSLCDLLIRARRYEDALASVEPLTELEVARSRHAYRDVWGAVALARAHLGDASGARLAIRYAEDNWRSRAARVLLSESRG